MTVSLLIKCDGNISTPAFIAWIEKTAYLQRLAGGTILNIEAVETYSLDDKSTFNQLKYQLLPGFVLKDRSSYLETHYLKLQQQETEAEILQAWLDFCALKQKARPKSNLISNHLKKIAKEQPELLAQWQQHLEKPYQEQIELSELNDYFQQLKEDNKSAKLVQQWQDYLYPTEKTEADWEYQPKPETGYLVPIMVGYKAISKEMENAEIANTRDNKTPVCFVETVHSIGEWQGIHRIKNIADLASCIWSYHHEKYWYLCQQKVVTKPAKKIRNR